MTLKKGQRFGIVRKSTKDTNPYVYRALSSGEGKLQLDGYGFKAVRQVSKNGCSNQTHMTTLSR